MSTTLHIGVDMFGIATAISSVFHDDQDRSAFVKYSWSPLSTKQAKEYNVMVFNLGQNYDERFNGIKSYSSAVYQNLTFGILGIREWSIHQSRRWWMD